MNGGSAKGELKLKDWLAYLAKECAAKEEKRSGKGEKWLGDLMYSIKAEGEAGPQLPSALLELATEVFCMVTHDETCATAMTKAMLVETRHHDFHLFEKAPQSPLNSPRPARSLPPSSLPT